MPDFVNAVNTEACKGTLSREKAAYVFSCGLSIGAGTDKLRAGKGVLRRPSLLRAAHTRHHEHDGEKATLYMLGNQKNQTAAHCSDEYKELYPDVLR
jgi:lipopolysaccharide export system protein LptA